jgi:predicted membrane-bound spermidine synthase
LRFYLIISFLEGGAVMVCELLGARMFAPFYGTTLFVWSTVIGVTLAALAAGYIIGGYLADRYTRNTLLFTILAIGSGLIALMPDLAKITLNSTSAMDLRTGALVSALAFLLPPLACLGTVSPIVIRLASRDIQHTGRVAGTVFAVSTISGIIATFLLGFYIIPVWGITMPAHITAVLLGVIPLVYFIKRRKFIFAIAIVAAFSIPAFATILDTANIQRPDWTILYKSDGLLGQVIVADLKKKDEGAVRSQRMLFVNRQPETIINSENGYSVWAYVHAIAVTASIKPPGSKALILGLGGGSIADEFLRLGFSVAGCELDERIVEAAQNYFHLDPRCRIIVDDARHYIRMNREKYDIVAFDTYYGEQPPAHLLSVENFLEVKCLLKDDGLVIINFPGFITDEPGLASRCIIRTMMASGFHTKVIVTPGAEMNRNLIFVGSPAPFDFSHMTRERQNACCTLPIPLPYINAETIDLHDAFVLSDDKPILDLLNLSSCESWRRSVVNDFSMTFKDCPIF